MPGDADRTQLFQYVKSVVGALATCNDSIHSGMMMPFRACICQVAVLDRLFLFLYKILCFIKAKRGA